MKSYIINFMNSSWIKQYNGGVLVICHVTPRAAQDSIQGLHGDALKIRLHAPPVDGKANEALISFLSRTLNIPKGNITLKSGTNQRRKTILITGLSKSEIEKRLLN